MRSVLSGLALVLWLCATTWAQTDEHAGKGGGAIKTGRFLSSIKGNQGDLLTTLLSCAGVPVDRPVGIATKQIAEIKA